MTAHQVESLASGSELLKPPLAEIGLKDRLPCTAVNEAQVDSLNRAG